MSESPTEGSKWQEPLDEKPADHMKRVKKDHPVDQDPESAGESEGSKEIDSRNPTGGSRRTTEEKRGQPPEQ